MKKIKNIAAGLLVAPAVSLHMAADSFAQFTLETGKNAAKGTGVNDTVSDPTTLVTSVVNALLWFVGILAVVMLIWGGIRYATSAGDSNKVTAAKNTILYAVIGLVVAIFAYAIVNFVIAKAIAP